MKKILLSILLFNQGLISECQEAVINLEGVFLRAGNNYFFYNNPEKRNIDSICADTSSVFITVDFLKRSKLEKIQKYFRQFLNEFIECYSVTGIHKLEYCYVKIKLAIPYAPLECGYKSELCYFDAKGDGSPMYKIKVMNKFYFVRHISILK